MRETRIYRALPRRQLLGGLATASASLGLAGCGGNVLGNLFGGEAPPQAAPPPQAAATGPRIGLILPLSAQGPGSVPAIALRNAAEMAVAQFNDPSIQLIIKDDKGTPEGARAATQEAISEGAQIILGPLFATSVVAAGEVAKPAGRTVIGFSTDANAASRGVYLLSFMVESEVARIVSYAVSQRLRNFAALIPEGAYGNVAAAAFEQSVAASGGSIVMTERFPPDGPFEASIDRILTVVGSSPRAQALFLPADADTLARVAPVLVQKGFNGGRVRLLGTGVWNDSRVFGMREVQGAWFASPDSTGFNTFAQRYRARYNQNPTRIATLSYDAVSLAIALARRQGARPFSDEILTNPSGYEGADGAFRFRPNGTNERALAVLAIRGGGTQIISAAPQGFQGT